MIHTAAKINTIMMIVAAGINKTTGMVIWKRNLLIIMKINIMIVENGKYAGI
ncbi:hypothetical protein [Neobacillus niacini]|uniref:hypothetical protein n=1 Tax=Neobacillus niacini TaxID=86668 RepID=UPI001C8EDED4|nr:hypothetical protein [Neobacillus niacini]MBY0149024.1 hypothetical protein [Neobacillus niacini]